MVKKSANILLKNKIISGLHFNLMGHWDFIKLEKAFCVVLGKGVWVVPLSIQWLLLLFFSLSSWQPWRYHSGNSACSLETKRWKRENVGVSCAECGQSQQYVHCCKCYDRESKTLLIEICSDQRRNIFSPLSCNFFFCSKQSWPSTRVSQVDSVPCVTITTIWWNCMPNSSRKFTPQVAGETLFG